MARRSIPWVLWARRAVQTASVLLFTWLFLRTVYRPEASVGWFDQVYFDIDPLLLVSVWAAGGTIVVTMLLSLLLLLLTFVFGRWFCGWVCPLGAVHNFFSSLRALRNKEKLQLDRYSPRQNIKYYVLIAVLVCAVLGVNLAGWLDPASVLYRSMAVAVYPAVNDGLESSFEWLYVHDAGVGELRLSAVTEPVYSWFRYHFLSLGQPRYLWGTLIGVLFAVTLVLNLYRQRFWCRYICPLGALLAVVGRTPAVRLRITRESCNDCQACVMDCQGGADPETEKGWRAAECFYCWNCYYKCKPKGLSFRLERGGKDS